MHIFLLRTFLFLTMTFALAASVVMSTKHVVADEFVAINVAAADWPWWRGPNQNGIAATDQTPPLTWSKNKNVLWKSRVLGRGHSSPTVVGNHIYLATAEETQKFQSVICFDRSTGKQIWKTDIHRGGLVQKSNAKSSHASSSIACDGQQIYVNFLYQDAIYTTALTRTGRQVWQQKISDYVVHQGYGASPAIYQSLVLVAADNKGGGAVAALDRGNGKIIWKHERPEKPNYTSPIVLNVAGRDQLVMVGCDQVSSLDPLSGKKLWKIDGATTECVTSTVTDGQLVFSSGGYPRNHVSAIRGDGSGEVVWENEVRIYVPSMSLVGKYLYAVADAGIAMCWEAATGKTMWKERLGGTFSSSPIVVGRHVYVTNETGTTYIFTTNPNSFELVAKNQLGDDVFATPAICGNRIYMRFADQTDQKRQEFLVCLGNK